MSKICSKCGAPMDDDQNFCEVCGAKAELPVSEPEKPVKPKKGKKEEPAAPAPKPVAEKELPAPLSAVGLDVAAPVAAEVVPEPAAEPAPEPKP